MRLPNRIAIGLLLSLGCLFASGNIWFAAVRSTIPRTLHSLVVHKEIRREKHPGRDDVYLVELEHGQRIQVDFP
jgi:hypothetical protein